MERKKIRNHYKKRTTNSPDLTIPVDVTDDASTSATLIVPTMTTTTTDLDTSRNEKFIPSQIDVPPNNPSNHNKQPTTVVPAMASSSSNFVDNNNTHNQLQDHCHNVTTSTKSNTSSSQTKLILVPDKLGYTDDQGVYYAPCKVTRETQCKTSSPMFTNEYEKLKKIGRKRRTILEKDRFKYLQTIIDNDETHYTAYVTITKTGYEEY